jgi:anaphase-promoting complex subunit 2
VTLDRLAVLNLINESKMENMKIGIIMMKLKMPLQLIKASLEFWVDENVLIQSSGGWKMNE